MAKDDDNSFAMHLDDDCNLFQNYEKPHLQINGTPLEDSQKADNKTSSSSLKDLTVANTNDYLSNNDSQSTPA